MRRERGLLGLASLEVVHVTLLWVLVLAGSVPFLMVVLLAVPAQESVAVSGFSDAVLFWLSQNYRALMVVIVVAFVAYTAAAVLSVAAQGGIVSETARSLSGAKASASSGLTTGFRLWWRSAAILALPALPSLIVVLGLAVALQVGIAAPLAAGARPDFLRFELVADALAPVSSLFSIAAVPLSVWAFVSLRFAIIDDLAWRASFARGWRLLKSHPGEIALMFIVVYVVAFAVALAAELAAGAIAGVLGAIAFVLGIQAGLRAGAFLGVIAALVLLVLMAVTSAGLSALSSVCWTVMWTKLTVQEADPIVAESLPS